MLYTIGFNYYIGYMLYMSVTNHLMDLNQADAEEYYKIIYIKSGPSNFVLNDREFAMTGACAICLNGSDKITFRKVSEDEIKILWFKPNVIHTKLTMEVMDNPNRNLSASETQDAYYLMQFMKEAGVSAKILSLHTLDAATIDHKLQILTDLLDKQDTFYWPCRSRSYLIEILFCFARLEEDEESFQHVIFYEGNARFAFDVIYYLQSCYNQKITIEMLSDLFHTNRTTLLNDFKKITGLSVNRYLIELRLKMASALLRDTDLTVDEISDRTGFHDVSYLSKVFKRKLSYTPSEYRKLYYNDPYGTNH